MIEMFGVYALLLTAWGIYSQRRAAAHGDEDAALAAAPSTPAIVVPVRERGAAARRHLGTTP
jgi:hypothetical protein